ELGLKGKFLGNKLYADINGFFFDLKNAIVQKRDISGADFFENAGSAKQWGLESYFSYELINQPALFFNYANAYLIHTLNDFHYHQYQQLDKDYSGNKLPGVASETVAARFEVITRAGSYANTSSLYSGEVFLHVDNTHQADP